MKEKLVVILGPTAVGKTNTSIALAKRLNGEIISGDSMQVYKGMDIGTAKVTKEEMSGIPHHLIDIKEPNESFSVAEFQEHAKKLITEISARGKLPIIAGGTGLYVQAVTHDYQFSNAETNWEYRNQLELEVKKNGIDKLYEQLMSLDPEGAKQIHPNNHRRVIRALEVIKETGMTMGDFQKKQKKDSPYDLALIGLTMERELLYNRINARVDLMIAHGLLDEVNELYHHGIRNCQSVQAIGYKELFEYVEGKVTLDDAIENLKQNSRRYAKRQLTWFRNKMDLKWFDMDKGENVIPEILQYTAGKLSLIEK
jgi:tRNA dimethylallyltransferase